jgi:hypothetical protein
MKITGILYGFGERGPNRMGSDAAAAAAPIVAYDFRRVWFQSSRFFQTLKTLAKLSRQMGPGVKGTFCQ